MSNKKSMVVPV